MAAHFPEAHAAPPPAAAVALCVTGTMCAQTPEFYMYVCMCRLNISRFVSRILTYYSRSDSVQERHEALAHFFLIGTEKLWGQASTPHYRTPRAHTPGYYIAAATSTYV